MNFLKPPLFVISAPSGAGKTTLVKRATEILPRLVLSVSHTTREPRKGEKQGKDYFFVDREEFEKMIAERQFLEWAQVYGNYYGTSEKSIDRVCKNGDIVVLDIDVQGAMNLKKITGLGAVFIFVSPPSRKVLADRLKSRGTEEKEIIEKRLKNAEYELSFQDLYDHVIINDDLELAVREFLNIVEKETTVCKNDSR